MPLQAHDAPPTHTQKVPAGCPSWQPRTSACCVHQQAPSIIKVFGPGPPRLVVGALCWPASNLVPEAAFLDDGLHLRGTGHGNQMRADACPGSMRWG